MKPRRRAYIIWIPEDEILGMFCRISDRYLAATQLESGTDCDGSTVQIPKDVAITSACHSWERKAFGLMLEHPSFPEVPSAVECPSLLLHSTVARIAKLEGDPDPSAVPMVDDAIQPLVFRIKEPPPA